MELTQVLEAQQRFATALNMEQVKAHFLEVSKQLGFDSFVYALRVPTNFSNAQVIMLDGYPEGWVKRYFEAAYYESDPVMAWCIREILPIRWSDLILEPGSAAEAMMLDAAEYGLRDGVTMPVHSPQGELGILSLSLDAPPERARAITETALPIIQLLATHLHQAVRRLGSLSQEVDANLTMRERECLTWAADGKTSNEIAQLLGISDNTVNFHLNNAMQKLDVVSRQHAIGKASFQRLIQPKPF
ncbi:MAG: LuxR family transcriptional regulator [Methylotenera sp.]|nr:LuxR family transcriptional regulator [Methylotenera sp.]